jgi:hypothetical protein
MNESSGELSEISDQLSDITEIISDVGTDESDVDTEEDIQPAPGRNANLWSDVIISKTYDVIHCRKNNNTVIKNVYKGIILLIVPKTVNS